MSLNEWDHSWNKLFVWRNYVAKAGIFTQGNTCLILQSTKLMCAFMICRWVIQIKFLCFNFAQLFLGNTTLISIQQLKLSMGWEQWTPTLNLLSLKSLSRSLSFSTRASLSKARAAIMRPLPILRAAPRRRLSFSLFSRGLTGRRMWGASAALPWHPPPKLRRCGLSMTSRSSSFNRSRGSNYKRGIEQAQF